ncbi:MAG: hypothetical protein O2894_04050 [Planctomycetota bacterium]|nr:hypothetical protein [Planctomycetota bacterium]
MLTSLKTVSVLMLLAGVSLGVFANTLVASGPPAAEPPPFNERVEAYRRVYNLDDAQVEAIRTELNQHRQGLYDLLLDLRRNNQDRFAAVVDRTENRIRAIIEASNPQDSGK